MTTHDWEPWKLSHAYPRIGSGTTPTSTDARYYTDSSGTPWVTTAELRENYLSATTQQVTEEALNDFPTLRIYESGSVMIAMYGATIGRLGMTEMPATCNQACCVFEASSVFDNRFLFYWFQHRRADLIALSVGGGQANLSQHDLKEERVPCPPIETQRRIARFLDEKTVRIDALIKKKRELLDRLAEKRQVLITQAVTEEFSDSQRLDYDRLDLNRRRDCRVEGKRVQKDWGKNWLKWSVDLIAKPSIEEERETLPYISNENIEPWTGKLLIEDPQPVDADSHKFKRNDILFNKLRPYLAKVYHTSFDGACSSELLCLRPSQDVDSRYLFYVLVSKEFIDTTNAHSFGAKMPRADWKIVSHQLLLIPPLNIQRRIAEFLDEMIAQIDRLTKKIRGSVALLEEYRSVQIAAVVTGQISVSE